MTEPITDLDHRYSAPGAVAVSWEWALQLVVDAGIYWLTTVRSDGRPHVTPLIGVWMDGALFFCTGVGERKARNLVTDRAVAVTTGSNSYAEGFDVVLEGTAEVVRDTATLYRVSDAYVWKYGEQWRFHVTAEGFRGGGGPAVVYRVAPATAFGFGRDPFSQTRWRFDAGRPGASADRSPGD
ncbi:pyridoxamine 5'-phosphate oxidase family protein [Rhodococcus sp. NPDC003318]|uniref:pyridoxamine 5'-phosphate oxidase family protein n=1 Tax=Rhodococcus sp. NPDC003318 TaxID=3364503 RepID=UPI0036CDEBF3